MSRVKIYCGSVTSQCGESGNEVQRDGGTRAIGWRKTTWGLMAVLVLASIPNMMWTHGSEHHALMGVPVHGFPTKCLSVKAEGPGPPQDGELTGWNIPTAE